MEPVQLKVNGVKIYEAFRKASQVDDVSDASTVRYLQYQKERFQLWARSLGLFQQGHASLDYRVRDVLVMKQPMSSMLQGLLENLEELASILLGQRPPFEEQRHNKSTKREDNETEEEDGNEGSDNSGSEPSSIGSSDTQPDSENSFGEAQYRLQLISEAIDSLYSLATKIRNPKNRPQRSLDQICKHVPPQHRAGYIQERENLETMVVAYVQRQQVLDLLEDSQQNTPQDELSQYCSEENWLIRRAGVANARRKLQFVYWREHTRRLGDPTLEPRENQAIREKNRNKGITLLAAGSGKDNDESVIQPASSVPRQSMATSATNISPGLLKPHDAISVISRQSRVSTVVGPTGDKVTWPPPPLHLAEGRKFFSCPYCFLLCPGSYLSSDSWRNHLIHDLQPYHCTYEACQDPNRLYGSRQEWIDHETQHTRVWHCQQHTKEFPTQPEYVEHLQQDHVEAKPEHFSAELLSSVVGPSTKLQRDCPFCPTGLGSLIEMQRHLAFHMERLALLALPRDQGDMDTERGSKPSEESHEAQQRGRTRSTREDFDGEENFTIDEDANEYASRKYQRKYQTTRTLPLTEGDMERLSLSTPTSGIDSSISLWLDDIKTSDSLDDTTSGDSGKLAESFISLWPNVVRTTSNFSEDERSDGHSCVSGDFDIKYPKSFHRLHIDRQVRRFLKKVRTAPRNTLLEPIRSPAYPPPAQPTILAPGGAELSQLPSAQGYVEYLGWIGPPGSTATGSGTSQPRTGREARPSVSNYHTQVLFIPYNSRKILERYLGEILGTNDFFIESISGFQ
ncbi:hypothetical protein F5B22DRAFT_528132 [Xylaria bambusicola]|uniref:uncharacterized protein n=1 Tax=Xylaria bambusicola TaxID=326684 RepID=UPI002008B7A2|nr:uncharacterized protein F5B22DRAFT_528132 [Xylaria bambusicola]KAI0505309.1 hypothetical protein F5B22DRAFT_528132 [Xylaria bambusicola]